MMTMTKTTTKKRETLELTETMHSKCHLHATERVKGANFELRTVSERIV